MNRRHQPHSTWILVNPGHGFEPTRLGLDIALTLLPLMNANGVLVPFAFPGLKTLLRQDFPTLAPKVRISYRLGAIYRHTLLDVSSYANHLRLLIERRDELERRIRDEVQSFETSQRAQVVMEVITGSRVTATQGTPTLFAFQGLLSSILQTALAEAPFAADRDLFAQVSEAMIEVEARYSATFLPSDSPFLDRRFTSHLRRPPIQTPPLRRYMGSIHPFQTDRPSTYLMVSGTGRGHRAEEAARAIGLPYIANQLSRRRSGVSPSEIFGPNIVAVVTRGGSGTHWLCQHARKPQVFLPFSSDDDPEIYFNIKHYSSSRVGVPYVGDPIPREALESCVDHIRKSNTQLLSRFNTFDGIQYLRERAETVTA